mmetsp:Transcript_20084/g.43232  ORF Transcript_20084/g.43232 Transcript_20084/m.43232 type:complete len:91 (-) Transcript_20084:139-411(-)
MRTRSVRRKESFDSRSFFSKKPRMAGPPTMGGIVLEVSAAIAVSHTVFVWRPEHQPNLRRQSRDAVRIVEGEFLFGEGPWRTIGCANRSS